MHLSNNLLDKEVKVEGFYFEGWKNALERMRFLCIKFK